MTINVFDQYRQFSSKYVSFNALEWELLKSKLTVVDYKKGEIFHQAGDVCDHLMCINQGIVRAYVLSDSGDDYTWSIFFNDQDSEMTNVFVVDYESFISQSASRLNFEVLADCQLLALSQKDLQFLYKHAKKAERFGRLMAELAYSYTHNLVIDRMTKSAAERYVEFVERTPYLLDKVPQYHIATLLGITPQSLSRIKKQDH